ncbi:MAG: ABC transporter permease [Bacteroidales bacterium]|nr:ABC transporter permease [Bacteroidales bacterium]
MSKLSLIIQREYLTRVKKKSFIIISLLAPIGMLLMMFIPALIEMLGTSTVNVIAVVDHTDEYGAALTDDDVAKFVAMPSDTDENQLRDTFEDDGYDAYMVINGAPDVKDNVKMYAKSTLTMDLQYKVLGDFKEALRKRYIQDFGGHSEAVDSLFQKVNSVKAEVTTINITDQGEENESSAAVGMIVAFVAMFLIYMFVLLSGSMVMNGVMEEKSNRIVEVLISSVKPFDLMMGKVIGIALTMLTQFAIWIIVGGIVSVVASSMFATPDMSSAMNVASDVNVQEVQQGVIEEVMGMLSSINIIQIVILFVVYFLCGYMLYASLFACIGSAVENQSDAQQFMMPVTIAIVVALYLALYAVKDPNSSIAFWGSMVPFTSPVVMMARLPFSVPAWEIALSIAILVASFVGSIWVAARIYRVGILMYGKKVTLKELVKWFKQAD